MQKLIALLLVGFFGAQTSYAIIINSYCDLMYLNNNSGQALEVSGIYPDSEEILQTTVLKPYETQQSIVLETLRTCSGNTSKIKCHAIWRACHKNIKLVLKTVDTGTILFSGFIYAKDTLSINKGLANNQPLIVLINDIPQY